MSAEVRPEDLLSRITDLERRLDIAESTSRLASSSVRDGTLVLQDSNGTGIVTLGKQTDNTHGIKVQNETGRTLFEVTSENGQVFPHSVASAAPLSLVSGTANSIRPGLTATGAFFPLFVFTFDSVGPFVDYDLGIFPNGGNMDWKIQVRERVGGVLTDAGPIGLGVTVNVPQTTGTFTIPAGCLAPGTGTDPAGRHMWMEYQARANTLVAATVDLRLNSAPISHA